MITAGVALVACCLPLCKKAPTALMIVTFVGGVTCFLQLPLVLFKTI